MKYIIESIANLLLTEKGCTMRKDSLTKEIKEKYKEFLLPKEKLVGYYKIGSYTILITDFRVLMKKDFPQNLFVFKYKDIEIAEYVTKFSWFKLVLSIFSLAFGFVFYNLKDTPFTKLLGAEYVTMLFSLAFLTAGIISLVKFLMSLSGRVRILLKYYKRPIVIYTSYTEEIPEFIKHLESNKSK